jgi:hypothetical protein
MTEEPISDFLGKQYYEKPLRFMNLRAQDTGSRQNLSFTNKGLLTEEKPICALDLHLIGKLWRGICRWCPSRSLRSKRHQKEMGKGTVLWATIGRHANDYLLLGHIKPESSM